MQLKICLAIDDNAYELTPLLVDQSVARRAFRFRKLGGDQAVYDVRISEHGPECECLGFLRHGRCKHINSLTLAKSALS